MKMKRMVKMVLKKNAKISLILFIIAVCFAIVAIDKTLSGDYSIFVLVLTWLAAILWAIVAGCHFMGKGYRESAGKTKSE